VKGGSNILLSATETADMLDIHVETLYRQWRSWGLTGVRVGRNLKFRLRDVENWIEKQAV
jgi:excisionase family DNA binding protein